VQPDVGCGLSQILSLLRRYLAFYKLLQLSCKWLII